jgi:hypothetical protein
MPKRERGSLSLWQRWRTSVMLGTAAMGALAVYMIATEGYREADPTPTPQRLTQWRWEGGNCSGNDWSGRFYNLSDREISGTLWAIMYSYDVELDRDREVIANLPAGSSEGVRFVFSTEMRPTRCIIDGFDPYP